MLESRSWFVLAGAITDGIVKAGMVVSIPLNGAASMTAPIDSIEFVLHPGGAEDTCLCIRYTDADELSIWRGLNIGGETIEVTAGDMPDTFETSTI